MAYARKSRKRSYRKKGARTTKRKSRAAPRRYAAKKRSTMLTKKRILNTSSTKKRNGMLSWSNTTITGSSQTVQVGKANAVGTQTNIFLFCPTAMDLTSPSTHGVSQEAGRTSRVAYMRGFSEQLRIQTSSSIPWFHRRICFTHRGPSFFSTASSNDSPTQPYAPYVETTNGLERLWFNQVINNMPNTINNQQSILFKGASGQDWDDPILAPIDTSRVTVKFDKTWTLKSGNQSGTVYERKLWHPMNHNLVYDDDESGVTETSSHYSVASKPGMGDYYIMDILSAGLGGTTSDLCNIYSNSTMYWHEK